MSASKEDLRSSKVNFDAFMEDMQMVVTYVAGDETGGMNASKDPFSVTPPPLAEGERNALLGNRIESPMKASSSNPSYHLGAAAIVSSRRVHNAGTLLVDMEEIQSALNASFAEEWKEEETKKNEPSPMIAPKEDIIAPMPSHPPKPSLGTAQQETVRQTRGTRAAGHSDAPKPLGFPLLSRPVSPGTSSSSLPGTPSGTNTPLKAAFPAPDGTKSPLGGGASLPMASTFPSALSAASSSHLESTSNTYTFSHEKDGASPQLTQPESINMNMRPSSPSSGMVSSSSGSDLSVNGTSEGMGRVRNRATAQVPMPSGRAFNSFEELLLDEGMGLLKALCTCLQVTEATKTCASIVMVFESKGRVLRMLQSMIEYEVSMQKTAATLFRNNSLTTHLMTCYTKLVGLPFLKTIIGPVILDAFAALDEGVVTYEIDPSKLSPSPSSNSSTSSNNMANATQTSLSPAVTATLKANVSDLKKLVHSFFDRILNSRAVMPKNFMEICNTLQTTTVERFPESRYFVIGGFLFLRYICPAVVAPDGYKLISATISDSQRRMLVLVSKILQTIANERTFGEKEEYMMCMNPLVHEYQGVVQYFFNQLAKPVMPETPENTPSLFITSDDFGLALKQIYAQVKIAKPKLLLHPIVSSDPRLLYSIEIIESLALLSS